MRHLSERKAHLHFELLVGMMKQHAVNKEGRPKKPWNAVDYEEPDLKPKKISFEMFKTATTALNTL